MRFIQRLTRTTTNTASSHIDAGGVVFLTRSLGGATIEDSKAIEDYLSSRGALAAINPISSLHIFRRKVQDSQGKLLGYALLGGYNDSAHSQGDRYLIAQQLIRQQLPQSQPLQQQQERTRLLAYSLIDQQPRQGASHQKDIKWNVYLTELDASDTDMLFSASEQSAVTDACSLLASLYPQDYINPVEFYCGILATVCQSLSLGNNKEDQVTSILQAASHQILERLKRELSQNQIADELRGLSIDEAYAKIQHRCQISFRDFHRRFPQIEQDILSSLYKLNRHALIRIEESLTNAWRAEEDSIKALLQPLLTQPSAANVELINEKLEELVQSPISLCSFESAVIAVDARIYGYPEYLQLTPQRSITTRESFVGMPCFKFDRMDTLVKLVDRSKGIADQEVQAALVNLCRDMVSGELMQQPKIAVLKQNNRDNPYIAIVCDQTTLERLKTQGYEIKHQRDFQELLDVTKLLPPNSLAQWHQSTPAATKGLEQLIRIAPPLYSAAGARQQPVFSAAAAPPVSPSAQPQRQTQPQASSAGGRWVNEYVRVGEGVSEARRVWRTDFELNPPYWLRNHF